MNKLLFDSSRLSSPDASVVPLKRMTAIDVGTNSIHAIIVDVLENETFEVVDRLKEQVGFGQNGLIDAELSEESIQRGLQAMMKVKTLSERRQSEVYVAYATSAVRETRNGGDFVQRVIDEVGIKIQAIPGKKEASLIGMAVQRALALKDEPVLIMDIGGGSTEFIIANRNTIFMATSFKIGASRLYGEEVRSDPLSSACKDRIKQRIHEELDEIDEFMQRYQPKSLVVCSGTLESITTLVSHRRVEEQEADLNGFTYSYSELNQLYKEVRAMNRKQRIALPGIEERRANNLLTGIILQRYTCKRFGLKKIIYSGYALREGMVIEYAHRHRRDAFRTAPYIDVRHKSVHELLRKCKWHEKHSVQVTRLALRLFDDTQHLHKMGRNDRELLKFASMLHDIGYYISRRKHHKHALYIILNADLKGFRPEEIEIIAHVARYHRRSIPKERHELYNRLEKNIQQRIRKLSGFLRVADGLDRSHFQNVIKLQAVKSQNGFNIQLVTESDAELEIWGAKRKSELLQELLGSEIVIERVLSLPGSARLSNTQ